MAPILSRLLAGPGSLALAVLLPAPAGAQLPDIDQSFIDAPLVLEGDQIRFCVYPDSAIGAVDRAVAQALGDVLLVEVEIHEVEAAIRVEGIDTIPISFEDLFLLLSNECDVFMGLELATGVYPDWLNLTRPYLEAPYVAIVRDGAYDDLAALDAGASVATQSLTTGDTSLGIYLETLPEDARLRRRPYPTTDLQIERLLDGTVEAAIVWQPWLEPRHELAAGVEVVPSGSIRLGTRQIGIGVRSRDLFIRGALDNAIAALLADGTLDALGADIRPAE